MTTLPEPQRADTDRSPTAGAMTLTALGVVFGDIGTSPLYAVAAAVGPGGPVQVTQAAVLGLLSLIVWSLMLIVTVKYVGIVLRADHDGEGGILALSTLVARRLPRRAGRAAVVAGILGASLFVGDAVLTPAISVLSAVEGIRVADPTLPHLVAPAALAILTALFAAQRFGTERIGRAFGPVMALWFLTLGALGLPQILAHPTVLLGLSPVYAVRFALDHPGSAFLTLGVVVLALTGAEALYADLGHFGRAPIRRAWFAIVLPALVVNYLGQGALVLANPSAAGAPFFHLAPRALLVPIVLLGTAATIIASQATIAGTFSLARQGIRLGYLPHLRITSTSRTRGGQVYLPMVNWAVYGAVVVVVLGFGSAARLATAYGVAVTTVFTLTTTLVVFLARARWNWGRGRLALFVATIGTLELAFLAANLTKVVHGGWLPLAIAAVTATSMLTWRAGQKLVVAARRARAGSLSTFLSHDLPSLTRVPGTVVYPHSASDAVPLALRLTSQLAQVAHTHLVIVRVASLAVPYAAPSMRVQADLTAPPGSGVDVLTVNYGFHEAPDLPSTLGAWIGPDGQPLIDDNTLYVVASLTMGTQPTHRMAQWRQRLYNGLASLSDSPTRQFGLPSGRTLTITAEVD